MMARRGAKRLRKCVLSAFNDYFILTGEFISSLHYRREFGGRRRRCRRSPEKPKETNKNVGETKSPKKRNAGNEDRGPVWEERLEGKNRRKVYDKHVVPGGIFRIVSKSFMDVIIVLVRTSSISIRNFQ